jgi:transcriptional regulator NrdR family protein
MPVAPNIEAESPNRLTCPSCGGDLAAVKDSRPAEIYGQRTVRRRRECMTCKSRVNTMEMPEVMIAEMRRSIAKDMILKLLMGEI